MAGKLVRRHKKSDGTFYSDVDAFPVRLFPQRRLISRMKLFSANESPAIASCRAKLTIAVLLIALAGMLWLPDRGLDMPLAEQLSEAAQHGDVRELKSALACGALVDQTDDNGTTALIEAARAGHPAACEVLIKAGAKLNVRSNHLGTPLMQACVFGNDECVAVLLTYGADPNIRNEEGNSALDFAAISGCAQTIERILLAQSLPVFYPHLAHNPTSS
jgi:ankyrin repeat protein